ncbi:MAG: class I SAM-dependent methyltransferase [Sphingomonadaceae bacterium]|nr:class I SAM-dependent methyltransferase [Sphingomonadaceae bacterium]
MSQYFDLEPEFRKIWDDVASQTMTGIERGYALWQAVGHIIQTGIAGDLVECGVWRGGSAMLMARALHHFGDNRRHIHLFDTFAGMTAPDARDIQAMSGRDAAAILSAAPKNADDPFWGIAPLDVVQANMARSKIAADRVHYIVGDVATTIPDAAPADIALLRLDTDWYASTAHELRHLWPRLSPGGILLIDDYGYWQGARAATDDWLTSLPAAERPLLQRIDFTGRMGIKPYRK